MLKGIVCGLNTNLFFMKVSSIALVMHGFKKVQADMGKGCSHSHKKKNLFD